jgi:hypothetical protein
MLTDQTKGPFKIQIIHKYEFYPTAGRRGEGFGWLLLNCEGRCVSSGFGFANEAEARAVAVAVRDNEMA